MEKIIPHLWFDKEAVEAAEFYTSIFPDSKITNTTVLRDTPSGDTDVVTFELSGHTFMAISAGPLFKFNPSISFMLNFDPSRDDQAETHIDELWEKLSEGGNVLMPINEYPFSKRYGWVQDKYGVSWQLMLTNPEGDPRPFIIPSLLFVGDVCGKAEEALTFYADVFSHKGESKVGMVSHYGPGQEPNKESNVNFAEVMLLGQWFAAMDSALMHDFAFNEAISLIVNCESQEEIDYFWEKLSADPKAEQCGWLKDKYGVSWQIIPQNMDEVMSSGDEEKTARMTQAFLKMKKIDLAELEKAAEGK